VRARQLGDRTPRVSEHRLSGWHGGIRRSFVKPVDLAKLERALVGLPGSGQQDKL